ALALGYGSLPLRRDHAHTLHALHTMQKVDAAGERPPAVASALQERQPADPALADNGRQITAHAARGDLDAEQRHPVLEPRQIDKLAAPWKLLARPVEHLTRAPQ